MTVDIWTGFGWRRIQSADAKISRAFIRRGNARRIRAAGICRFHQPNKFLGRNLLGVIVGGMVHVGIGYDVHAFAEGRKLILGGVEIPYALGLDGHSDADVLMHAICDAVLGALGEMDIGHFFPNTDPRWKGARSRIFLRSEERR